MTRKSPEHQEQVLLFRWLAYQSNINPELKLVYAIPNGGSRGGNKLQRIINGKRMKDEGVKKGCPDLCVPIARKGYHSMYLEMKAMKGKLSPEQKEYIEGLSKQGHYCTVCFSYDEAKKEISNYIGIKD